MKTNLIAMTVLLLTGFANAAGAATEYSIETRQVINVLSNSKVVQCLAELTKATADYQLASYSVEDVATATGTDVVIKYSILQGDISYGTAVLTVTQVATNDGNGNQILIPVSCKSSATIQ
ncbi:MAG: hypothetical protein EOP05_12865 [Proteobacteria bacterium]|nr:MAG: hypothetical protein EOP05_12865 [Pseudomonadota bacterium]